MQFGSLYPSIPFPLYPFYLANGHKITKQLLPGILAFLGMKLGAPYPIPAGDRAEAAAIACPAKNIRGFIRLHIKGMHKIKIASFPNAFEQGTRQRAFDLVPPDMRHAQTGLFKFPNFSGYQIQTVVAPELLAVSKQQLQPEAQAEQRFPVIHGFADCIIQSALLQIMHRIAERANAGKNQPFRSSNCVGIPGNHRSAANRFYGFLYAPEIAHSVIDNHRFKNIRQSKSLPWWMARPGLSDLFGWQDTKRAQPL